MYTTWMYLLPTEEYVAVLLLLVGAPGTPEVSGACVNGTCEIIIVLYVNLHLPVQAKWHASEKHKHYPQSYVAVCISIINI